MEARRREVAVCEVHLQRRDLYRICVCVLLEEVRLRS